MHFLCDWVGEYICLGYANTSHDLLHIKRLQWLYESTESLEQMSLTMGKVILSFNFYILTCLNVLFFAQHINKDPYFYRKVMFSGKFCFVIWSDIIYSLFL